MSQLGFIDFGNRFVSLSQILDFEFNDREEYVRLRLAGYDDCLYFYDDLAKRIVRSFREAANSGFIQIYSGDSK